MKHILYLITRDDGQKYIGITIDYRIKNRMAQHKLSERFKDHAFSYVILQEDSDRSTIEDAEPIAIEKYDTFFNGLNSTRGGKGFGHNSKKFNTLGFKFSEESRKKMSIAGKARAKREGFSVRSKRSKIVWSDEKRRKNMSDVKKGKASYYKISEDMKQEIFSSFKEFSHAPKKSRNGLMLSRERAFAKSICKHYNVTQQTIYGLLTNKD